MARILIVDDDPALVRLLTRILRGQGWEVGAAGDGGEALARVKQGGWSVVLLDIRLPKIDGLTALKLMREQVPDLPVIVITGKAEQGDMLAAYRAGAYACLVKPLDEEEVVQIIRNALARPHASRNWAAAVLSDAPTVSVDPDKKTEPLDQR